jgi:hypothetical protein
MGLVTEIGDGELSYLHSSTTAGVIVYDRLTFDNPVAAGRLLSVIDSRRLAQRQNEA